MYWKETEINGSVNTTLHADDKVLTRWFTESITDLTQHVKTVSNENIFTKL